MVDHVTEQIKEKPVLDTNQEIAAEQAAALRSLSQAVWALVKVMTKQSHG